MKLSDFYFEEKALAGKKMPILLPNGEDSGEWLNVVSPDADVAGKAGRAFIIAYRRGLARFEELEKAAKKSGDYTEYNLAVNELAEDLNRQLAAEVVNGFVVVCWPENTYLPPKFVFKASIRAPISPSISLFTALRSSGLIVPFAADCISVRILPNDLEACPNAES